MLRDFIAEAAQNPKVGMAVGGLVSSAGAASTWFDLAKEWISGGAMFMGLILSIVAFIAQVQRIRNERRAERRAQELHDFNMRGGDARKD